MEAASLGRGGEKEKRFGGDVRNLVRTRVRAKLSAQTGEKRGLAKRGLTG